MHACVWAIDWGPQGNSVQIKSHIMLYCMTTELSHLIHDLVWQEVARKPALARGAESTPHGTSDLRRESGPITPQRGIDLGD